MQGNVTRQFDTLTKETNLYKEPLSRMQKLMLGELNRATSPQKIVKTFKKAITKRNPRYVYNLNNSMKMKMLNILPAKLQDFIISRFF